MSRFARNRLSSARFGRARPELTVQRYDTRVVDRFYAYCQAVASAERHRDEARHRAHGSSQRTLWVMLVAGVALFHYLAERVAQALTLY